MLIFIGQILDSHGHGIAEIWCSELMNGIFQFEAQLLLALRFQIRTFVLVRKEKIQKFVVGSYTEGAKKCIKQSHYRPGQT